MSIVSLALGFTALVLFVFGAATRQIRPLAFGAAALGASFAGISVGWALDIKGQPLQATNAERRRIRGMQVFFALVVAACVILSFLK